MARRTVRWSACLCVLLAMLGPLVVRGDTESRSRAEEAGLGDRPTTVISDANEPWVRTGADAGPDGSEANAMPNDTPPDGQRVWDGRDPFRQPVATTNYYGSGDVDLDGSVTQDDADAAQQMADGLVDANLRADVDGSGAVDAADVTLISAAAGGATLPAWWNELNTRSERESWLDNVLALDQTDAHPHAYWWQCGDFAVQLYTHLAYYRGDLFHTQYDGGQTIYNLPLYTTSVISTSYGHGINAILLGDDPLDFEDWRFIEPQNDDTVVPGAWDMPYGMDIRIRAPSEIFRSGYAYSDTAVVFHVEESGWTLLEYSPDLVLTRQEPGPTVSDNRPDIWNTFVLPTGTGWVLCERMSDDLTPARDIYLVPLSGDCETDGTPLIRSQGYSRLLDTLQAPDGSVDLLWTAKPDDTPGVFCGRLDLVSQTITDTVRISSGTRMVRMGRLARTEDGDLHAFWLEDKSNTGHPHVSGIYWCRRQGDAWQAEENVTPQMPSYLRDYAGWQHRDMLRYLFDVVTVDDGLLLAWTCTPGNDQNLYTRSYDGLWHNRETIASPGALGLDMGVGTAGTVHLVYWVGDLWQGHGNLLGQTFDGSDWSELSTVDASGSACCPQIADAPDGGMYMAWARGEGGMDSPAWSRYDRHWCGIADLSMAPGESAWYPAAHLLTDGSLLVTCSARDADHVSIATWTPPMHRLYLPVSRK